MLEEVVPAELAGLGDSMGVLWGQTTNVLWAAETQISGTDTPYKDMLPPPHPLTILVLLARPHLPVPSSNCEPIH